MMINQYDTVLLKNGTRACIVEIFDGGKVFLADITLNGITETDWLDIHDIECVISEPCQ